MTVGKKGRETIKGDREAGAGPSQSSSRAEVKSLHQEWEILSFSLGSVSKCCESIGFDAGMRRERGKCIGEIYNLGKSVWWRPKYEKSGEGTDLG